MAEPSGAGAHDDVYEPAEVVTESIRAIRDPHRPGFHVRIFGSREFFRLWLSQVIASLGDWLGFLAIVILAARVGAANAAGSVGVVMAARIIPGFFFAAGAGVLIDRMDRKQVMVVTNVARATVVCTLPFVDSVLGLVFASLVLELCTLFFSPAKEATVPNLVPPEHLTTANSLGLAAAYGTFPLASLLFTVLATVADQLSKIDALDFLEFNQESVAFYVAAACYIVTALMIAALPIPRDHLHRNDDRRVDLGQVFGEIKEGWSVVFINPIVRAVNVGLGVALIGGGMLVPLGPVFSVDVLHEGPAGFGVFITALGLGVTLGVIGVSILQRRLRKARVFAGSVVGAGVCLLVAASMSTLLLSALWVAMLGVCAGSVYVLGFTLLHENVDDELRGRVFSSLYTLVRLCVLIAFAVGPFLAELLNKISESAFDSEIDIGVEVSVPGVRLTLWLAGLIMLIAGVLAALSLRSGAEQRARAEDAAATRAPEPT
jgi:dTMP kinase